ncbi:hypothetical protein TNCV_4344661 [Trichonephila clavipes]|nr:hypothetical protein TNCV_4344661 [Trichonephila clavipes]
MFERFQTNVEVNRRESPLKVEYVTPRIVTSEAEPFMFGRSRDYYPTIGPCHPLHVVDVEVEDWLGNCIGHLSVGWIKGGERLTLPSNLSVGVPGLGYLPTRNCMTVETSLVT